MDDQLRDQLEQYEGLLKAAHTFMCANLIQSLSKAVLQHAEQKQDERFLLDLSYYDKARHSRETTPWFRLYVSMTERMSLQARMQMYKINSSGYSFPENISMMLEQCDYWESDSPVIVEMAAAYIEGRFDSV